MEEVWACTEGECKVVEAEVLVETLSWGWLEEEGRCTELLVEEAETIEAAVVDPTEDNLLGDSLQMSTL